MPLASQFRASVPNLSAQAQVRFAHPADKALALFCHYPFVLLLHRCAGSGGSTERGCPGPCGDDEVWSLNLREAAGRRRRRGREGEEEEEEEERRGSAEVCRGAGTETFVSNRAEQKPRQRLEKLRRECVRRVAEEFRSGRSRYGDGSHDEFVLVVRPPGRPFFGL